MTFKELEDKMPEITGLLFTHPNLQAEGATEIWMKFRNDGVYVFIDFEQPFPELIEPQKLVGKGNALNCSDYKKDNELVQQNERNEILSIIDSSVGYRGNIKETIVKTRKLFEGIKARFIHY